MATRDPTSSHRNGPHGQRLYSPYLEEIWEDEPPEPIPGTTGFRAGRCLGISANRYGRCRILPTPIGPLWKTSIVHDVSDQFHPH